MHADKGLRAPFMKIDQVTCEVNSAPPNPVSDKFHAALGFLPVGSALLSNGKTVTYLSRPLSAEMKEEK
jgi:uncharacterized protein